MPDFQLLYRQLAELDLTPLLLAVLLGGMIGLERQIHGRPAGLRTHILVCLASTLLIFVSRSLPELESPTPGIRVVLDPTRLAAGIVTGVGFLGAATVIRSGDIVRGITTGACIWAVSGLGVVIGYEAYGFALAGTAAILLVLVTLNWAEGLIRPLIYRRVVVRGRTPRAPVLAERVRGALAKVDIGVKDVGGVAAGPDEPFELVFSIRCRNALQAPQVLETLGSLEGVSSVEWS